MKTSWFVRGDIDGFFGLFIDNLLQLMLIAVLCGGICGFPSDLITQTILPGAAVSILLGNLFYAWQARKLMAKTGRADVTALPYGINTPSLVAYVLFIMLPVKLDAVAGGATPEAAAKLAWQAGLFGCLMSGVMETVGAFVGDWLRRSTPRAALLSALAGIAITFIAMSFVFQIFASPVIAILPMMMILITYASRVRLPLGLPGGLVAVAMGVGIAWILRAFGLLSFQSPPSASAVAFYPPMVTASDTLALLTSPTGWKYMAVIFPMGLFNVIGSLQNLESAEAAGDRYETMPSLLANGIGSLAAAFFGSAFPTTIYIGHPGWKAMGARAGYSILNGAVVFVLCLIGGITLVQRVVPLEATLGILLWVGIIITAQAFQEVPKKHALAVALGLIPLLGAWALFMIETTARKAGSSLVAVAPQFGGDLYIYGVIALNQGFLLTSMILAAVLAFIIDREFLKAAGWTAAAALFSTLGLIHAYELTPAGVQNVLGMEAAKKFGPTFGIAYALSALLMAGLHFWNERSTNAASLTRKTGTGHQGEPQEKTGS